MKLLILGDLHLTDKQPENRIDDYKATCIHKFWFILNTAKDYGVDAILQPGDFTDSPNLSYEMFSEILECFEGLNIPIITTFGQHDMKFRRKENTVLHALHSALGDDRFEILCREYIDGIEPEEDNIAIQGAAYNDPIPEVPKNDRFNVLLIHKMIVNEKDQKWKEQYDFANIFLMKNKFDLIVSGDNHLPFIASTRDKQRHLINCGSMMRSTIAQIEHEPFIVLFDVDERSYEKIFIPIQPAEQVFKLEQIKVEKERDDKIKAFVAGLSEQKEMGMSFEDNLVRYIRDNKVNKKVVTIIEEAKQ